MQDSLLAEIVDSGHFYYKALTQIIKSDMINITKLIRSYLRVILNSQIKFYRLRVLTIYILSFLKVFSALGFKEAHIHHYYSKRMYDNTIKISCQLHK